MPHVNKPLTRKNLVAHLKQFYGFYIPFMLFVVASSILLLLNSKADLHLWLTSVHTPYLDVFFKYYTEVGGSVPYIAVAGLLFYRYRMALFVLLTQLASGIVSVTIKNIAQESRPQKYFAENFPTIELHRIEGVQLYNTHSFPSGHTITAFVFFLSLVFFSKRPALHFLYFTLALLVGYSRIYLSQHFAFDVLAGAVIGVLVTVSFKPYLDKWTVNWCDKSLSDVFSRKKN